MDALRTRITKESATVAKVQMMAEQAKRSVDGMEPRIEKALATRAIIDKLHHEITHLEATMKIEAEKSLNQADMIETNLNLMDNKVQNCCQTFNTEMSQMEAIKVTVKITHDQVAEFKEQL